MKEVFSRPPLFLVLFVLASACSLFEEIEPIVVPETAADAGMDSGPADDVGFPIDASDLDSGPDVGVPDAGVPDAADMMMPPNEPWQCPPKFLADDGRANTEVQVEPLDNGRFLATWSTGSDSSVVVVLNRDGSVETETVYNSLVESEQRVELLTDETDTYGLWLATQQGLINVRCSGTVCTTRDLDLPAPPESVDGAWNGGEEAQYAQAYITQDLSQPGPYVIGIALLGESDFLLGRVPAPFELRYHSLVLYAAPPAPTLQTGYSGILLTPSRTLYYTYGSAASAPELVTCGPGAGPVGKVFGYSPVPEANAFRVVTDFEEAGLTSIADMDCVADSMTRITERVGSEDWATLPPVRARPFRTFVAGSAGLVLYQFNNDILEYRMDTKRNIVRIDATQATDGTIAVLTVDDVGVVELRKLDEEGSCL